MVIHTQCIKAEIPPLLSGKKLFYTPPLASTLAEERKGLEAKLDPCRLHISILEGCDSVASGSSPSYQ